MITISAIIFFVTVLVSAIKVLFGVKSVTVQPMTSAEEDQFDMMKWNPETLNYDIRK